ncbi:MAG TPA: hypothetical protein VIH00_06420 [Candidatus Limnocylindrales bacterium]
MPERPVDESPEPGEPADLGATDPTTERPPATSRPARRRAPRPEPGPAPSTPTPGTPLVPVMAGDTNTEAGDVPAAETAAGGDAVSADVVSISQGGVQFAQARHVDIVQGGIMRAEATDIAVSQGAIGLARGDRVSLEMGGMLVAVAREARISQAYARQVIAREVDVDQAAIGTLVTARASFARRGLVGILVARQVEGDVRALLDWRGALAFGAALGVLLAVLRRR